MDKKELILIIVGFLAIFAFEVFVRDGHYSGKTCQADSYSTICE